MSRTWHRRSAERRALGRDAGLARRGRRYDAAPPRRLRLQPREELITRLERERLEQRPLSALKGGAAFEAEVALDGRTDEEVFGVVARAVDAVLPLRRR